MSLDFNGILTKKTIKIIDLIVSLDTQWRYVSGMSSHKVGLDYNVLFKIAKIKKIKLSDSMLQLIQIAEIKILEKERGYEQSDT